MGRIASFWNSFTKSRYTCYLEQELERTRTELREWQELILTEKGLPHLSPGELRPLPKMRATVLPSQLKARLEAFTTPKEPNA